jgi:hypothetical protein
MARNRLGFRHTGSVNVGDAGVSQAAEQVSLAAKSL